MTIFEINHKGLGLRITKEQEGHYLYVFRNSQLQLIYELTNRRSQ